MARVVWGILLAVFAIAAVIDCAATRFRVKRGYNNGYGDSSSGFGRGSDERDASEESGGCSNSGGGGYGRGYSGSRELAYNRDGRQWETRGGRSLAKSTASAVASAASYTVNQKSNVV